MSIPSAPLKMDQGETRRVVNDFTGSAAPFDDLTGASVTLFLKPRSDLSAEAIVVPGSPDAVGDDGKAHTCRSGPLDDLAPDEYLATMAVSKAGEEERTSRWLKIDLSAAP